ncbi:biotin/lipoyl-containing protein [Shinella pollutisoli]|uniref:Biotin carboxyl carrier protein of acetyl-CoA carboxylase n=1 Tax=Shinella pollutisoli TaxID=2250594 RepID=A0ABV7DHA4_9HYPH|nr:biotin/lipoyl-containing protein [Shinella pollutisoli]
MTIKTVEAMLPGVIYLSPSPDTPPFKAAGDRVAAGETVALVEVMKSFLPVEADSDGTFLGYSTETGSNIEPGEAVCRIEVAQ